MKTGFINPVFSFIEKNTKKNQKKCRILREKSANNIENILLFC